MKTSSLFKLALPTLGFSLLTIINASAITYQNSTNVEFTFNPTINVSLSSSDLTISNLAPGGTSDSNVITATVSTNAGYGYYLSATAGTAGGNTNLTNTSDSTYNFASLSSNAATLSDIPDNKWGYSYSTDNGTTWISGDNGSALAGYNGLPLDADDSGATGVKLLASDSFATSGSVKFKIGARASSDQAAGTYTGTVNFYAVTNTVSLPYMQDLTATKLNQLLPNIGDTTTAIDKRDEQFYQIAKLADGKYWMVENLNIAGGTALSADDTDVTNTYISSFSTSNNLTRAGNTIILPASAVTYDYNTDLTDPTQFTEDNYSYVFNSGNKTNCGADGLDDPCYSYYSWDAATLGSGRSISVSNIDTEQSICPKGWKLPRSRDTEADNWQTENDFYALARHYATEAVTPEDGTVIHGFNTLAGPGTIPNFSASGYYEYASLLDVGYYGYYWTATSGFDNSYSHYVFFGADDSIETAGGLTRHYGLSVRCILAD